MARPVGAPPRLTEPPRPWKKAIGTPHSRPRRVSRSWVLASSQLDERKPPSLFESEYPIITSNTPPWARTVRRTSGTCSRSRTISGARRRSSMDSRSEEHTSELQSQSNLVCRLLLEKKKKLATRGRYHTVLPGLAQP